MSDAREDPAATLRRLTIGFQVSQAVHVVASLSIADHVAAGATTLLIVERALGEPNEGADNKFSDLNMLVVPGGQERTVAEYAALFEQAGYDLTRVVETASPMMILEARVSGSV